MRYLLTSRYVRRITLKNGDIRYQARIYYSQKCRLNLGIYEFEFEARRAVDRFLSTGKRDRKLPPYVRTSSGNFTVRVNIPGIAKTFGSFKCVYAAFRAAKTYLEKKLGEDAKDYFHPKMMEQIEKERRESERDDISEFSSRYKLIA